METITLSIPAVDVLGEQLNLNVRQYPFEIPRPATAEGERAHLVEQVFHELETSGLARSGRPEPELEDALYLLTNAEVAISAAGLLDVRAGTRLAARVAATGEVGVAGVIGPRGMRMHFLAPDELPGLCADLLPDVPPGAGEFAHAPVERPPSGQGPPAVPASEDLRAVEVMTSRPKFRLGHYLVTGPARVSVPSLIWFDNDQGRYAMLGDAETLTCGPADKSWIADQLADLLALVRR